MNPGENPPVGLILCKEQNAAVARYALDRLPNKILAAEYRMKLPNERLIAAEFQRKFRKYLRITPAWHKGTAPARDKGRARKWRYGAKIAKRAIKRPLNGSNDDFSASFLVRR